MWVAFTRSAFTFFFDGGTPLADADCSGRRVSEVVNTLAIARPILDQLLGVTPLPTVAAALAPLAMSIVAGLPSKSDTIIKLFNAA